MESINITYDGLKVPEATLIQKGLREKLDIRKRDFNIKTIAGADISLNMFSKTVYAGIIVLSFPDMKPVAHSVVKAETHFPYVPGYLAFREVPALFTAWNKLPAKPDVLVIDGQGIAHPRRLGVAAHFGIITGQASIGCAKKMLFGLFQEPDSNQGASNAIYDKDEIMGYALRTKEGVKPVFISPGHRVNLDDTLEIMQQCVGKHRIPEPTRLAHELVNKFRRGEISEGYALLS